MISSMTGFGAAEVQCEQWTLRAEVRSVNHRDLRLSFRMPDVFQAKELELQKLIEAQVHRGHLHFVLTCQPRSEEGAVLVDEARLKGYVEALRSVAEAEGVPLQMDLSTLLRLPGALRDVSADSELGQELWPHVLEVAAAAVESLVEMRRAEGANLREQLGELCNAIEDWVSGVEGEQAAVVAAYQERLVERVERLLQGTDVPVNEESLAREVALFADRADVSEEIARLRSHLEQFRQALDGGKAPVGRKMEFLGQEMLREAGTMAAKVPAGPLVEQALELKNDVERLREQVRNVE